MHPSPRREPALSSVAVVVPTVDEAATIGPICRALVGLRDEGVCDRVLVVDQSTDATAQFASAAGAQVIAQGALWPELGPVLGKGDAMWRALDVVEEDVVVYLDGDTRDFVPAMARDLIAAVTQGGAAFAKAAFRRPWDDGRGPVLPDGGGRVTELTAKPLLAALFPELAAFEQPLAGEIAVRADLLRSLPFATGYAVDVALLIDAWRQVGSRGLAQVPCPPRQNRHRPLAELLPMADVVCGTILARAGLGAMPVPERAPHGRCAVRAITAVAA